MRLKCEWLILIQGGLIVICNSVCIGIWIQLEVILTLY